MDSYLKKIREFSFLIHDGFSNRTVVNLDLDFGGNLLLINTAVSVSIAGGLSFESVHLKNLINFEAFTSVKTGRVLSQNFGNIKLILKHEILYRQV